MAGASLKKSLRRASQKEKCQVQIFLARETGAFAWYPFWLFCFHPEIKPVVSCSVILISKYVWNMGNEQPRKGDFLKNQYIKRFGGAKLGIYGNSREEAFYPLYKQLDGEVLDGSKSSYKMIMTKKDQDIAKAFWSLTMYDAFVCLSWIFFFNFLPWIHQHFSPPFGEYVLSNHQTYLQIQGWYYTTLGSQSIEALLGEQFHVASVEKIHWWLCDTLHFIQLTWSRLGIELVTSASRSFLPGHATLFAQTRYFWWYLEAT